jgi:hypothetical protein
MVSSAKRHKLNTWVHLRDVLWRLAGLAPGELEQLLPDRWQDSRVSSRRHPRSARRRAWRFPSGAFPSVPGVYGAVFTERSHPRGSCEPEKRPRPLVGSFCKSFNINNFCSVEARGFEPLGPE